MLSEAGADTVRNMAGETVCGFRVAAWRETHPEHGDRYGHVYSEHWSTPSANPAVKVERLFTESQLRAALAARAESQGELLEALRLALKWMGEWNCPPSVYGTIHSAISRAEGLGVEGGEGITVSRTIQSSPNGDPQARLSDGWRAIDSAPRDGTHILAAYVDTGHMFTVAWFASDIIGMEGWSDGATDNDGELILYPAVTHWMPLPSPPAESGETGQQGCGSLVAAISARDEQQNPPPKDGDSR